MIIELDEYTTLLLLMMALSSNSILDGCTESLEMIMWSENKTKQSKTMMQQILERHLYLVNKIPQNILTNLSSIVGNQLVNCDLHRELFTFSFHQCRIKILYILFFLYYAPDIK